MMSIHIVVHLLCLSIGICHAQRIAEIYCQKYRDLTVVRTAIIALTSRPVPVFHEVFNCSRTVKVIVGGTVAREGEFPHQALIGWPAEESYDQDYQFLCGGSLISERFVVTAAHCTVHQQRYYPTIVRLGEHDLENDFDHQIDFDIEEIIKHPDYRISSSYHDIALLKLEKIVRFSSFIRPACLWTSKTFNFSTAIASGFGQLGFEIQQATELNKVSLEIFDPKVCSRSFPANRRMKKGVVDQQICVGSFNGRDTCKGDSGGPLQVMTEEKGCLYHLVGITSRGQDACGFGSSLSIFTRVSAYVRWIEQVVWDVDVWVWD